MATTKTNASKKKQPRLSADMRAALKENLKDLAIPANHRGGGGIKGDASKGRELIEQSNKYREEYKKKHGFYPDEDPNIGYFGGIFGNKK